MQLYVTPISWVCVKKSFLYISSWYCINWNDFRHLNTSTSLAAEMADIPFANDGSFMEKFLKMQQGTQMKQEDNAQPPLPEDSSTKEDSSRPDSAATGGAETSTSDCVEDFISSSSFTGAKHGYVFKKGLNGLGYYKDVGLKQVLEDEKKEQQAQAKAKPVLLKTNKSIAKIVPKRPAEPSGSSKKQKTGRCHAALCHACHACSSLLCHVSIPHVALPWHTKNTKSYCREHGGTKLLLLQFGGSNALF